jgi:pimeloyl-ACP methyl ester carboxylesterase
MDLFSRTGMKWAAMGFMALIGIFWVISAFFPRPVATGMMAALRASAGLEVRSVTTPFGDVAYLEGGEGPTIVMLHGIYARKEHWIDFTRELTDRYHVIAPDLPGFGDNPVSADGAYSYAQQEERFAQLVDALSLDQFHLAGSSMGGQLGALFATRNPNRISSLAFIGSPAGVTSPVPSDMEKVLSRGGVPPLLVTTAEDFTARFDWLFPDVPYIPGPVTAVWAADEAARAETNKRIWHEVGTSSAPRLDALAPMLTQPSLIVWCREDRVFHFSGAAVLSGLLQDDELVELSGCGHVPMLDKPRESGAAYRAFLDRQHSGNR